MYIVTDKAIWLFVDCKKVGKLLFKKTAVTGKTQGVKETTHRSVASSFVIVHSINRNVPSFVLPSTKVCCLSLSTFTLLSYWYRVF